MPKRHLHSARRRTLTFDRFNKLLTAVAFPRDHHATFQSSANGDGLPFLPNLSTESSHRQHVLKPVVLSRNHCKVYYGLPKDPDLVPLAQAIETDSDEELNEKEKGHRRKRRREFFISKSKGDVNAPPPNRMPFPPPSERDRLIKLEQMRDVYRQHKHMLEAARLGQNDEQFPSVVCSTLYGEADQLACVELSEDCELLAAAYQPDNVVRLWPTGSQLLYKLQPASELPDNPDSEAALDAAFDKTTGESCQVLSCHGSCAMACKFSPCRRLMLAACDDGVIRMFNLFTYELTCQYRGNSSAIWCADYNPNGFYFASAGHDRSTRIWNTETVSPLRIFVEPDGEDITCVKFHPNGQCVATGSWNPGIVRLYDVSAQASGGEHQAVRQFYGHNSPIKCIAFSRCGRYIVSADEGSCIWIWDIQEPSKPVTHICPRKSAASNAANMYAGISHIEFSHDNNIFVAADLNCKLHVWDARGLFDQYTSFDEIGSSSAATKPNGSKQLSIGDAGSKSGNFGEPKQQFGWAKRHLLKTLHTKKTPLFTARFTRRNQVWVVGPYVVDLPGETVQALNKPLTAPILQTMPLTMHQPSQL